MVETCASDTEVSDKDAAKGHGGQARFDVVGQMTTYGRRLVRVLGALFVKGNGRLSLRRPSSR